MAVTEYNKFYVPASEMMVCLDCGAAVRDTETHTKFHENLLSTFSIIGKHVSAIVHNLK